LPLSSSLDVWAEWSEGLGELSCCKDIDGWTWLASDKGDASPAEALTPHTMDEEAPASSLLLNPNSVP
jgi:hypothetical protein